jgi:hypothetical protein
MCWDLCWSGTTDTEATIHSQSTATTGAAAMIGIWRACSTYSRQTDTLWTSKAFSSTSTRPGEIQTDGEEEGERDGVTPRESAVSD